MIVAVKVFFALIGIAVILTFFIFLIIAILVWINGGFDESSQIEDFYHNEDEDRILWGDGHW